MKLAYISPSSLPSRTANSVHVVQQCDALCKIGADVSLYAKRTLAAAEDLPAAIRANYGVDFGGRLVTYYRAQGRAENLMIAWMALRDISGMARPDIIISRNLYASFYLAVLRRRPILFETHQLEAGFRKYLQKQIMTRPWVSTVCISDELVKCLGEHHGIPPSHPVVLHDAAPEGISPLPREERRATLTEIAPQADGPWAAVCGYFGHLYPGRGLEIIQAMAQARPNVLFLIFGGNEADILAHRQVNALVNLHFMGHVPHPVARRAMTAMDILLMPYQHSVQIGAKGQDTARWMSPMKMFEYMASGVPLVSSDLPVLREVLRGGENSLLVPPADADAWIAALDRLLKEPELAKRLGAQGHEDYLRHHTWTQRAHGLLDAARAL